MKKHLILFFAGVILSYGNIKAQTVPDKKEILKVTLHVNDYFMKKYADYRTPSFVKKVVRPSNIWTRSVYYEGLMALYSIYPADEYYLYAKEWADYHQWGFHRGTTTRNADNYCASQIYLDLYIICNNIIFCQSDSSVLFICCCYICQWVESIAYIQCNIICRNSWCCIIFSL